MNKITTILKTLALTLTVAATPFSLIQAQNKDGMENSVRDLPQLTFSSGMGNFHANFNERDISPAFLVNHLGEWLGTDSDHSFQLVKESNDELGFKHSVYQHYYKGVKVMDDVILMHQKNGKLTYVNGEIITKINVSANQQLTSEKIKSIILSDLNIDKVKISDIEEVFTKVSKGRSSEVYHTSKVEMLSLKPSLQSFIYYIDNSTRTVVKKISKIYHTDTPSVSSTYYKGDQAITVDSDNGLFRLKDNARNIHTRDGANLDIDTVNGGFINHTEYTNPVANFTTNTTKPPVEVHWAMEKSYDYYTNRHNRNSFDGNGSKIDNFYNYNFGSSGGLNAAALDTNLYGGIVAMLYGNGSLGFFPIWNPIVGLDVAGHEFSHLVISRNGLGGLNYQGESGAINEAIADMMGSSIEFYSGLNPNWTIGEGIVKPSIIDATPSPYMRNMSDPNNVQGALNAPQPDTYGGTFWINPTSTADYGGVHTNSGVGNFWFYLLSNGGTGVNDIGNTYNVTGITIQKAERIIYRALTNYMTPNTTYMDALNATKQAVTDLYGATGTEQQQNVNAWYAVGLGNGILSTAETQTQLNDQFTVYPNPVKNGMFTIKNNKNEAYFEIYDASGRLIKQREKLNKGLNKVSINGVQKGVHMLKINCDGAVITKKLIIE